MESVKAKEVEEFENGDKTEKLVERILVKTILKKIGEIEDLPEKKVHQ